jgi:hypothetical protein
VALCPEILLHGRELGVHGDRLGVHGRSVGVGVGLYGCRLGRYRILNGHGHLKLLHHGLCVHAPYKSVHTTKPLLLAY